MTQFHWTWVGLNEVFRLIQGSGNILALWPVTRSMVRPNYWLGSIEACAFLWKFTIKETLPSKPSEKNFISCVTVATFSVVPCLDLGLV